jgi:outer membrane protein TolC
MRLANYPSCPLLRKRRCLAMLLGPLLFAVAVGCTGIQTSSESAQAPIQAPIVRGSPQIPDELPRVLPPPTATVPKKEVPPAISDLQTGGRLGFSNSDPGRLVPINLDTVLRLAETQNGQTAVAREKVREAFANCDLAAKAWLPDLWVGAGWYRHEGGIADFEGNLVQSSFGSLFAGLEINGRFDLREAVHKQVQASRRVWQQRAELSKLSGETLVEASTAYVDLLAARAAEAVASQMEEHLKDLLKQSTALAKTLPAAEVDVARVQADLHGQQQLVRKFREASVTAGAKLLYLLGIDPASELAVMDRSLVAFTLVDANVATEDLVAQAAQNGPAIREVEGILQLVHQASAQANGLGQMMPVLGFCMNEGGFGTGPGSAMNWDNRWDFGVNVRWNLTNWFTRCEQQRILQAQMSQAHLSYQDLRAKLTMGVQESREAIHSGRDQMDMGLLQVKHAADAFERSKARFTQAANLKDRSPSEVLLAIRALNASNLAYLLAIRDHDKAQLRLAVLTGTIGPRGH